MRPLEIASFVTLAAALFSPPRPSPSRRLLFGATLAVMLAQALIEGPRWQLFVAYLVALVGLLLGLRGDVATPPRSKLRAVLRSALAASTLLLALALPVILPVPSLPPPDGPYPVGTVTFMLEDHARADRRLMVQAWYPAEANAARFPRAPYAPDIARTGPALARALRLPSFFVNHLVYAESHSRLGAPFAPSLAPAPVIIASHGLGAVRTLLTTTAEAMASHGYVVLALDHTGDAAAVAFPDGTVALRDLRVPNGATEEDAARLKATWTRIRADDVRFLLDEMNGPGAPIPAALAGHIDLSKIGVVGHSLGGSTAIEACRTDARLAACADLDGTAYGEARQASLAQPFLRTESDTDGPPDEETLARSRLLAGLDERVRGPVCRLHVDGSRHADFTDLGSLSPLLSYLTPSVSRKGSAETLRGTNDALLGFFDATLRGDRAGWSRITAARPRFEAHCARLPAFL
jgi:predicted dienelactone hydrolase